MEFSNYQILGGIVSPQDKRDILAGKVQAPVEIPPTFLPDYPLEIYYQGQQPACGGHAGARAVNVFEYLENGAGVKLSPRFVYALCKKIDGYDGPGTYGRAIMKVLQTYGVCEDKYFPNDIKLSEEEYADWRKIRPEAYENAHPRVIGPYAQVTDRSLEGLKEAVYRNKWVLILKKPWIPDRYYDGHFICGEKYARPIIYANSFGPDWGDKGYGFLSETSTVIEAWTAVDVPNTLIPLLTSKLSLLRTIASLLSRLISKKGRSTS